MKNYVIGAHWEHLKRNASIKNPQHMFSWEKQKWKLSEYSSWKKQAFDKITLQSKIP